MGKYLDKTGLQYFYGKLKEKFADKTTIENKLNSLTGALTWKGELSALPATTNYTAGNVIKVGKKEYVLTESNGVKSWDELGDEGSYLLKTTAESTYLKKADGEVKTANLADGNVTKSKLSTDVQDSLGKADNSLQIGATNAQTKQTVITTESTNKWESGFKVQNSSMGTEVVPAGITFGKGEQPIGIYKNGSFELNLTSAGSNKIKLTGVEIPTADDGAANKKYVDDKTSSVVKICQTNEPVSGHETSTTFKVNAAGYGSLQVTDATNTSTLLNGQSILIGSMSPSGEGANILTKKGITFGKSTQTFGSIQVNSNNKLQITGLDTPTSDTDAATKGYVDGKVVSEIYDRVAGYQTEFSDDLETTAYNVVPAINEVNTIAKAAVPKTALATSLQAITIYTDNTAEDKAANLANIKAYEDNLKAMGVDLINADGYTIPAVIDEYGFCKLTKTNSNNFYMGWGHPIDDYQMFGTIIIESDGRYVFYFISDTLIDVINGASFTYLATTAKRITPAINEVNALAKSKASTAVATTSANGLMSSADKTKLDGVADGATKVTGININGTVKTATNGIFSLGTVLTSADTGLNASSNNAISNSAVVAALNTKLSKTGLMTINNQAITGGGNINVATEKVTLAYNPDDSYMTGEQYRNIFTDAYEVGKIPNVELVYTAEGDYEVLSLKRIDKDDTYYHLYFSSSSVEDTVNVYVYGVQVDVLREDDSTVNNHDMTCTELQSTSINTIAKTVANNVDTTEVLTAATVVKSLTMTDKKNFILMPTVTAAQIRVPAYPTDGYTITVTGIAAVQNFELKTASSSVPIYNVNSGSTVTKYSLSARGKVVSTYSATLKQWITYRQAIN